MRTEISGKAEMRFHELLLHAYTDRCQVEIRRYCTDNELGCAGTGNRELFRARVRYANLYDRRPLGVQIYSFATQSLISFSWLFGDRPP